MHQSIWRCIGLAALLVLACCLLVQVAAAEPSSGSKSAPTVGMPNSWNGLVLPGTGLEAMPINDRRAPVVVRIVSSSPHGTARRYDLSWYGLEPGEYDLRTWLRRQDGSSTADLPPLPVKVVTSLSDPHALPHVLSPQKVTGFGNYRIWGVLVLAGWTLGLLAIIRAGRQRASLTAAHTADDPATLADRLRPLVQRGIEGTITPVECAILERCLFQHWTDRLGLQEKTPAECFRQLREHPEASTLVRQLEVWLHQPHGGDAKQPQAGIDVETLLRPYLASANRSPQIVESGVS